jgi:hypothetical protein
MEGATDAEATTIARMTATDAGISTMDGPPGIARYAYQDTTGTLASGAEAMISPDPYLRALGGFHHASPGDTRTSLPPSVAGPPNSMR